MFSKKYSEKYVKTLQEKNERLFEDLENAHEQVDQLTAAKERLESLAYKRGDKIRYLEGVVETGEQEVDHLKAVVKGLEEELEKASEGSVAMLSDLRLVESAYNDLDELLQKSNKSLEACGERLWELEEENSHLREELHDSTMELNGYKTSKSPSPTAVINVDVGEVAAKALANTIKQANEAFEELSKEQSKSPYPSVVINVDVRDTLTKQLAKSLKQVNEAFEKRYKEKRFSFFYEGIDYSSDSRTKLSEQFDNMFKLSLNEYASLLRLLDSLEKELEHKDFANGGRSFYSNKLQERVFITFKATKEGI